MTKTDALVGKYTAAAERLIVFCAIPRTAAEISAAGYWSLDGGLVQKLVSQGFLVCSPVTSTQSSPVPTYQYLSAGLPYTPRRPGRPKQRKLVLRDKHIDALEALRLQLQDAGIPQALRLKAILEDAGSQ